MVEPDNIADLFEWFIIIGGPIASLVFAIKTTEGGSEFGVTLIVDGHGLGDVSVVA